MQLLCKWFKFFLPESPPGSLASAVLPAVGTITSGGGLSLDVE